MWIVLVWLAALVALLTLGMWLARGDPDAARSFDAHRWRAEQAKRGARAPAEWEALARHLTHES